MQALPYRTQRFHPQPWRTAIVLTILFGAVGFVSLQVPAALWGAVPVLLFTLVLCAVLNPGLIVSRDGLAWYAVHPKWRFRNVPWEAVRSIRRGMFGSGIGGQILLTVEGGRYEPWVWGTPRRGRELSIEIWPNAYTNGEDLGDAIQQWWPQECDHPAATPEYQERV